MVKVLAWSSFGMAFVFLIWAACTLAGFLPAVMIGWLPLFTVPLVISILLAIAILVLSAFRS